MYLTRLKNGLTTLGLNSQDVLNNYVCVGGDGYRKHHIDKTDLTKEYPDTSYSHVQEFIINFGNRQFPEHKDKCICGHNIVENCYLSSSFNNYNDIIIIGNCCYKNYFANLSRVCIKCKEEHTNKNGLCNSCKKIKTKFKRDIKRIGLDGLIDQIKEGYVIEMRNAFKCYIKDTEKILNGLNVLKVVQKSKNTFVRFNYNELYCIANVFNKGQLFLTMNLLTNKPTTKSPNDSYDNLLF